MKLFAVKVLIVLKSSQLSFILFLPTKKRQRLIAKLVVTSLTHKRIEMKFYFLREVILTSFVVEIYLK